MEQLKTTASVTKVEIGNIKFSLNEVKRDLKDLGKDLGNKFKDLGNQIERRSDKTDAKINRAIYFFIGGLILKEGFDQFMNGDKTETKGMGVGK